MSNKNDPISNDEDSDEDFFPDCDESEDDKEVSNTTSSDESNSSDDKNSKIRSVCSKLKKETLEVNRRKHKHSKVLIDDLFVNGAAKRPCTRQTGLTSDVREKQTNDKDILESDDEENKNHTEILWSNFLKDIDSTSKPKNVEQSAKVFLDSSANKLYKQNEQALEGSAKNKAIVNELHEHDVRMQKKMQSNSAGSKENKTGSIICSNKSSFAISGAKKNLSAGISSVINQIGKKKKLSILEKSKIDWNAFKQDEGIEDQIQSFNKGKDGYLDRQDFLQRTDLRQFEIEKNVRQFGRRNHEKHSI